MVKANQFIKFLLLKFLLIPGGDSRLEKKIQEDFSKETIVSDEIRLNLDDSKSYFVHKSEEEGLKDIRKNIIDSSYYEDSWAYFPKDSSWYEIGIKSERGLCKSLVRTDLKYLKNVISSRNYEGEKIIFYHNHPNGSNSKNPSNPDFSSMVGRTLLFDLINRFKGATSSDISGYEISSKICHKDGNTEYFLTDEGRKYFNDMEEIKVDEDYFDKNKEIKNDTNLIKIRYHKY